ncbi:hypothetical protein SAMN04488542_1256 [Fontibacillus panacisegetis]|uniref:Uncharacterized protein n=1 Tax=Fontibacillus panacisegetis TaxID=670482 RepID=A0A1G7R8J6_9BACL|nr:hypothetical protein [Fontibacillus panacisegetis]SDG06489.1 hypothetical protein SAMN04488542_1256 [Fontibacillus panacisegetis]
MNQNEAMIELHLESLIRDGQARAALELILESEQKESSSRSADFTLSLTQLSHLCRLHLYICDTCAPHELGQEIMISDLILRSVQLGLLDVANTLAGDSDIHLQCILINALYGEGYISIVKEKIAPIDHSLLTSAKAPYREIAYIYAEILHDDERYNDAAIIFEALAEETPYMAKARYAACSCYLNETMNFLLARIELYHPGKDEQAKISKYLDDISTTLQIIHSTRWHTEWSLSQSKRSLSELPDSTLH